MRGGEEAEIGEKRRKIQGLGGVVGEKRQKLASSGEKAETGGAGMSGTEWGKGTRLWGAGVGRVQVSGDQVDFRGEKWAEQKTRGPPEPLQPLLCLL